MSGGGDTATLDVPGVTAGIWRKQSARRRWLRDTAQGAGFGDQQTPRISPLQSPYVGFQGSAWLHTLGQELTFEVPGRPPASGCFLALQPSLSQKRVTNFASVPPAVLHRCA